MAIGSNWNMAETKMAFALYFLLPSRDIHRNNSDIVNLARLIGRSPSSVTLKIQNVAANDPNTIASGKVGLRNGSKFDKRIWEEYHKRGDEVLFDAVATLSSAFDGRIAACNSIDNIESELEHLPEGKERNAMICQRINQGYFRNLLIKTYGGQCCITRLTVLPLLVASHIKPWNVSNPKSERLNPCNGLLLNALHDKAFDTGLLTIDLDYKVRISREVKRTPETEQWLWRFDGKTIDIPSINKPNRSFIEYHNDIIFRH